MYYILKTFWGSLLGFNSWWVPGTEGIRTGQAAIKIADLGHERTLQSVSIISGDSVWTLLAIWPFISISLKYLSSPLLTAHRDKWYCPWVHFLQRTYTSLCRRNSLVFPDTLRFRHRLLYDRAVIIYHYPHPERYARTTDYLFFRRVCKLPNNMQLKHSIIQKQKGVSWDKELPAHPLGPLPQWIGNGKQSAGRSWVGGKDKVKGMISKRAKGWGITYDPSVSRAGRAQKAPTDFPYQHSVEIVST